MALNLRGLFTRYFSSTATVTSFSVGAATAVTLAPSNPDRIGAHIVNDTGTLFVKLGSAASTTSYTYRLTASTSVAVPSEYTGVITAIKQSGTTAVIITVY